MKWNYPSWQKTFLDVYRLQLHVKMCVNRSMRIKCLGHQPVLNELTIVLAWLILNHYFFLKPLGPQLDKCKSGLLHLFENGKAIEHYRPLRNLHVATPCDSFADLKQLLV